ncbi:MAG TPA: chemotaxis protein CheB [Thermoanaerobaculia bacterium]|nr:chemotaxis protein CheB [Thermoanaerobaculia bacterium]
MTSRGSWLIVVGASLGGLEALRRLLEPLPARLPAAILVVQHRRADVPPGLTKMLGRSVALPVSEAEDRQPILSGQVIVAPSDYHLLVDGARVGLSLEEPVHHSRPSIDVLFRSAAARGPSVLGILLTAASADGAEGLEIIRRAGGRTMVQDPDEAESSVGPRAALALDPEHEVLPVSRMPARILRLLAADRERSAPPRRAGRS